MGFAVNRAVSGQLPNRFIPRGFTNFLEVLVDFWYNQARSVLGEHTARVLPLALTVFIFLLVSNWVERIPGFDSVGIITCAEVSKAGYPLQGNGPFLDVSGKSLKDRAGTKVTEADLGVNLRGRQRTYQPGRYPDCHATLDRADRAAGPARSETQPASRRGDAYSRFRR